MKQLYTRKDRQKDRETDSILKDPPSYLLRIQQVPLQQTVI